MVQTLRQQLLTNPSVVSTTEVNNHTNTHNPTIAKAIECSGLSLVYVLIIQCSIIMAIFPLHGSSDVHGILIHRNTDLHKIHVFIKLFNFRMSLYSYLVLLPLTLDPL